MTILLKRLIKKIGQYCTNVCVNKEIHFVKSVIY